MRSRMRSIVRALTTLGVLAGLGSLGGCAVQPAPAASPYQLQLRSSFDLGCPYAWVRIYQLDERTRGAEGCGRRLTYVETCEQQRGVERCAWMADAASVIERAASAWVACAQTPSTRSASAPPPSPRVPGPAPSASAPGPPPDPFADRH